MIQFPSAVDRPCQRPLLVVNGLVSDCYVTGEVAQFRFVRINQYIINPNDLTSAFYMVLSIPMRSISEIAKTHRALPNDPFPRLERRNCPVS